MIAYIDAVAVGDLDAVAVATDLARAAGSDIAGTSDLESYFQPDAWGDGDDCGDGEGFGDDYGGGFGYGRNGFDEDDVPIGWACGADNWNEEDPMYIGVYVMCWGPGGV